MHSRGSVDSHLPLVSLYPVGKSSYEPVIGVREAKAAEVVIVCRGTTLADAKADSSRMAVGTSMGGSSCGDTVGKCDTCLAPARLLL